MSEYVIEIPQTQVNEPTEELCGSSGGIFFKKYDVTCFYIDHLSTYKRDVVRDGLP